LGIDCSVDTGGKAVVTFDAAAGWAIGEFSQSKKRQGGGPGERRVLAVRLDFTNKEDLVFDFCSKTPRKEI